MATNSQDGYAGWFTQNIFPVLYNNLFTVEDIQQFAQNPNQFTPLGGNCVMMSHYIKLHNSELHIYLAKVQGFIANFNNKFSMFTHAFVGSHSDHYLLIEPAKAIDKPCKIYSNQPLKFKDIEIQVENGYLRYSRNNKETGRYFFSTVEPNSYQELLDTIKENPSRLVFKRYNINDTIITIAVSVNAVTRTIEFGTDPVRFQIPVARVEDLKNIFIDSLGLDAQSWEDFKTQVFTFLNFYKDNKSSFTAKYKDVVTSLGSAKYQSKFLSP